MTKKRIIEILRETKTATIAFAGLVDSDEVIEARAVVLESLHNQVTKYNEMHPDANIVVTVHAGKVTAGTQTIFLPKMPKTGDVCVKSHTYSVAGVTCAFADIVANSFYSDKKTYRFQTKAGNIIIIKN